MSTGDEAKVDVRERGANQQSADTRLFMQLQAFGGCTDVKPLVRILEASRLEVVLYQDVNDPRGVAVLSRTAPGRGAWAVPGRYSPAGSGLYRRLKRASAACPASHASSADL